MVLGTAETLGGNRKGFEEIDPILRIFKRTLTSLSNGLIDFPTSFQRIKRQAVENETPLKIVENIETLADHILLQRFAPASVMVNDKGDILYMTGLIGKYLEPVAGKANLNIFKMARNGLNQVLPGAFRKAAQNFDPVVVRNNKVGTNGGTMFVDVTVQCIERPDSIRGMLMVVFSDVPALVEQDIMKRKTGKGRSTGRQNELEIQLHRSYQDVQSIHEEMQTSQEELKSTNEELQSTNEELQSTNEELLNSKEEVQSLNEEMLTMNSELKRKVSDLEEGNSDLKNLLNTTEIAILFTDKKLNIRRFTDNVISVIKIRNADIGRPFTDQVSDLEYSEFANHARKVLKTLIAVETLVPTHDGRWFNVRIMPYLTLDDRIDGLVITFTDITVSQNLEIKLEAINAKLSVSEMRYRRLFESGKEGILILDAETGMILDINPFLIDLLGYSKEQLIEKAIWEIGSFKDISANKNIFLELQQKEYIRYKDLPIETSNGQKICVEFISNVYVADQHKIIQCRIRCITDN